MRPKCVKHCLMGSLVVPPCNLQEAKGYSVSFQSAWLFAIWPIKFVKCISELRPPDSGWLPVRFFKQPCLYHRSTGCFNWGRNAVFWPWREGGPGAGSVAHVQRQLQGNLPPRERVRNVILPKHRVLASAASPLFPWLLNTTPLPSPQSSWFLPLRQLFSLNFHDLHSNTLYCW